jgi:RNA polymerase sigma-70 factor (ECF subfamily)
MAMGHWIEAVYDELGPGLYQHALTIVARRGLADDAVQQTFVRLLERGRFGDIGSARAFLHAVLRHEAYRLLKQARRGEADVPEVEPLLAEDESGEQREERRNLERALRQLPVEQREVVHLKVWQQMTFAEIGGLLQVPLNTAASRYRYALERLRELMPREEV